MSGIAGVIRFDGAVAAPEIDAMLATMGARGPDRQAQAVEGNAGFGQALLATTPEALVGLQPWRHPETGCLVVSDSRLDHRPQLLRELGIGRPADEVGDGELLHAAWQRWGEGCADRLRGDFAFAIWNPRTQELFLARDPMGVRPLAFHHSPGRLFVFGSVADTVVAHPAVPRELDEGRIADALIGETEGIDQTCTFYRAVQRLPPATWLRMRDGKIQQQRYWRPVGEERPADLPTNQAEWIEAQRERLDRAVRLRLRSHRPVGSMLSGGLDSSSVVALAAATCAAEGLPPFPVFSATNAANPDCPETRAIRAVAAHVRCTPTYVDLAEFERSQTRARRLWEEAGEPFDGSMPLLASLYEAAAGQGVASLLDGVPADNLYATGRHAQFLFDQGRWREAWASAREQWRLPWIRYPRLQALKVMAGCLAPTQVHGWRDGWAEAREYRGLLRTSLISGEFARRTGLRQRYRRYRRTIGGSHQWHPSGEALSSMAAPYITAGLERYNRVAALYGVEPRPPYADRDLIEFQAWMPLGLRVRDGHLKWVLRQAMAGLLPAEVAWRQDKSHVGWRFNRFLLGKALLNDKSLIGRGEVDWLERGRLESAWQLADAEGRAGLQEALRTLQWHERVQGRRTEL